MGVHPAFGRMKTSDNGARGKVRVVAMVAAVTCMCPCGSPEPLVLPVVAGQYGRCQCAACGTVLRAESITYLEPKLPDPDESGMIDPEKIKPPTLNIGFEVKTPGVQRIAVPDSRIVIP